ncbi:hypothetical protein BN2537_13373 [Streptomyces venezuelae]|nr:hypothetical protein BN2537_13373 [Streptomyces venezuelae]
MGCLSHPDHFLSIQPNVTWISVWQPPPTTQRKVLHWAMSPVR